MCVCHSFLQYFILFSNLESTTEGKKELEKMAEEYITGKNQTQNGKYLG